MHAIVILYMYMHVPQCGNDLHMHVHLTALYVILGLSNWCFYRNIHHHNTYMYMHLIVFCTPPVIVHVSMPKHMYFHVHTRI